MLSDIYQLVQIPVKHQNTKTWLEKKNRINEQTDVRHSVKKLTID